MTAKVRKTLTLDPDVVEALSGDPAGLSTTVNAILVEEVARRQAHAALGHFLARLEVEDGPPNRDNVEAVRQLLR